MNEKMIGFDPIKYATSENLTFFWSLDPGWGTVTIEENRVMISVSYGEVELSRVELPFLTGKKLESVSVDHLEIGTSNHDGTIKFDGMIKLVKDGTLEIKYADVDGSL